MLRDEDVARQADCSTHGVTERRRQSPDGAGDVQFLADDRQAGGRDLRRAGWTP